MWSEGVAVSATSTQEDHTIYSPEETSRQGRTAYQAWGIPAARAPFSMPTVASGVGLCNYATPCRISGSCRASVLSPFTRAYFHSSPMRDLFRNPLWACPSSPTSRPTPRCLSSTRTPGPSQPVPPNSPENGTKTAARRDRNHGTAHGSFAEKLPHDRICA